MPIFLARLEPECNRIFRKFRKYLLDRRFELGVSSALKMTKLQLVRERKGFRKRAHLAFLAGVSERTVYNLEEGSDRPVSKKVRAKLAKALKVPQTALFTKKDTVRR